MTKLFPSDPINGGLIFDTQRRDTIFTGDGQDFIVLGNDAKVDQVRGLEDGTDRIDLTAWDASWSQLMVKQVSLRKYVVTYRQEEVLKIRFKRPAEEDIPESGVLLDADDFIFRPGLPDATALVQFETSSTEREVLYGTSSPDEFVFARDGVRDTIRDFEPGKDRIDLADYNINFFDITFKQRKDGRVTLIIPDNEEDGTPDKLVLFDVSRQLQAGDITNDWFIF